MSVDREKLISALIYHYRDLSATHAQILADEILRDLDKRLEPNLVEWIKGERISDIWIGKYCINAVMAIRNDNDFIDALLSMCIYAKDEEAGIRRIWRIKKDILMQ